MKTKEERSGVAIKILFIIISLGLWECVARLQLFGQQSELVFPTIERIGQAFINNFVKGYGGISLWIYIINSMKLLIAGLVFGVVLSCLLSGLAIVNKSFYHIYNLMVSIFDLLPGVALLPVVIIIFGVKAQVISVC